MKITMLSWAKMGTAAALAAALVGCGGASGTAGGNGGSATTDDAKTAVQEWYELSHTSKNSCGAPEDDSQYADTSSTTYERDERGLILTETVNYDSESTWGTSQYKLVREFTYDDEGWPIAEKRTETTKDILIDEEDPDAEPEEVAEAEPVVTEIEFTYERDDQGRVVKAESSDENQATVEFAYDADGNVVEVVRHEEGMLSEDGVTKKTTTTSYTAEGSVVGAKSVAMDESGETVYEKVSVYDESGALTKTVTTRAQDGADDLVTTETYTNEKDENGKLIKQTCTIEGDGVSTNDRINDGDTSNTVRETYMPDGTIKAQPITYSPEGEELLGEAKSYDGPYSVTEYAYDEDGHMTSYSCTYYDGVRHTDETVYDADGNKTSMTSVFMDGGSKTYEYTCDEHGNELTSKLVENKLPEGVKLGTQTEEMSTEWVQVKDPAPFLEMNDRYLMWL